MWHILYFTHMTIFKCLHCVLCFGSVTANMLSLYHLTTNASLGSVGHFHGYVPFSHMLVKTTWNKVEPLCGLGSLCNMCSLDSEWEKVPTQTLQHSQKNFLLLCICKCLMCLSRVVLSFCSSCLSLLSFSQPPSLLLFCFLFLCQVSPSAPLSVDLIALCWSDGWQAFSFYYTWARGRDSEFIQILTLF